MHNFDINYTVKQLHCLELWVAHL